MSTVTLDYIIATGLQDPASLVAQVQAIDLDHGSLSSLGFTVTSDTTSVIGGNLHRTLVLATNAQGDSLWGGDATKLKDITRNLFREVLNLNTPGQVTAAEPVVT